MTNFSYHSRSQFYRETDHNNLLAPHPAIRMTSVQMDEFLVNLFARTWDFIEKDTQICHMYGNASRLAIDVWEPEDGHKREVIPVVIREVHADGRMTLNTWRQGCANVVDQERIDEIHDLCRELGIDCVDEDGIVTELTPSLLRDWRKKMGLSQEKLANVLQVKSGRTVRRWESGEREIPGPVKVLIKWLITDVRPLS